jgi:hypothetical protein
MRAASSTTSTTRRLPSSRRPTGRTRWPPSSFDEKFRAHLFPNGSAVPANSQAPFPQLSCESSAALRTGSPQHVLAPCSRAQDRAALLDAGNSRGESEWPLARCALWREVEWVRNAKAAGRVTLSRGRATEQVRIIPSGPEESAPILKEYIENVSIVRPYFDVTADSPAIEFAAEASRHPVFRLEGV